MIRKMLSEPWGGLSCSHLSQKGKTVSRSQRHLPHTCLISWAQGCWTRCWHPRLGCGHEPGCSSGCRPLLPRPAQPGQGCPHFQHPGAGERVEPPCRTECGGHGARRSGRERQWHSWCWGCQRPVGQRHYLWACPCPCYDTMPRTLTDRGSPDRLLLPPADTAEHPLCNGWYTKGRRHKEKRETEEEKYE